MGIFSRFSDIVNANILHMLEKAEDPEKMVRLMIQEMEDTLVEVKSSAARMISEQKGLERRIEQVQREAQDWQGKAELAVHKLRDDLARGALGEKAKCLKLSHELTEQLQALQGALAHLRADIRTLEAKLQDTKARQKTIVLRQRAARGQYDIQKRLEVLGSGRVMAQFEQYERDLDRLEGLVQSHKLSGEPQALDAEFASLKLNHVIEDELQAIKEKIASPAPSAASRLKE